MRFRKISILFLAVFIAPCVSACGILPEEETFKTAAVVKEYEGTEFNMTTVKRGDIRDYRNIPCEFNQSSSESITIPQWLTVDRIYVKVGDKVKKGDLLAEINPEEELADIDGIRYEIKKQKKVIEQARRMCELEVAKQKLVLDEDIAIKAIRENYDVQISSYENELAVLRQQYKDARDEMALYQRRASINGTVTYVNTGSTGFNMDSVGRGSPGQRAGFGQDITLVTVSNGGKPFFSAGIDSSEYIANLTEGQRIKVTCVDKEYDATVHFPKDNDDEVYFMLDYMPDDISDGNLANAEYVIEEHKDVLYLPDISVNKMGDSYVVYYEDENGLKSAKEVTIGLKAENKVEITGGLEFGDAVIVR